MDLVDDLKKEVNKYHNYVELWQIASVGLLIVILALVFYLFQQDQKTVTLETNEPVEQEDETDDAIIDYSTNIDSWETYELQQPIAFILKIPPEYSIQDNTTDVIEYNPNISVSLNITSQNNEHNLQVFLENTRSVCGDFNVFDEVSYSVSDQTVQNTNIVLNDNQLISNTIYDIQEFLRSKGQFQKIGDQYQIRYVFPFSTLVIASEENRVDLANLIASTISFSSETSNGLVPIADRVIPESWQTEQNAIFSFQFPERYTLTKLSDENESLLNTSYELTESETDQTIKVMYSPRLTKLYTCRDSLSDPGNTIRLTTLEENDFNGIYVSKRNFTKEFTNSETGSVVQENYLVLIPQKNIYIESSSLNQFLVNQILSTFEFNE